MLLSLLLWEELKMSDYFDHSIVDNAAGTDARRPAAAIMLQGTASDVGKSLLATALCRIFMQDGRKVAPFKSQNMSLNSYVTPDGREIGRAQGMQADACGIAATTDMNPILLKPTNEMASQVVVHGKPLMDMDARDYREHYLPKAGTIVREALGRLRDDHDIVVIEGAGSPAEVNLKDRDIVNMRLAGWADAPVLLVADIDRGGVFAAIVGTMEILEPEERDRVKGILINKFRGDVSLLTPGVEWLERRIGKPVLGVVPYLGGLQLEDEDGASLDARGYRRRTASSDELDIVVIRLARISNFTDFDPLQHEPGVVLRYVRHVREWGEPDVVIIPGSKNTAEDLQFLRESGLEALLLKHIQMGGRAVGICGGYQMMGQRLLDPDGVESNVPELAGLALFPMETVFAKEKTTERVTGTVTAGLNEAAAVEGDEIHMGRTTFTGPVIQPFRIRPSRLNEQSAAYHQDGAVSEDGLLWGTYIHHIFHNDRFRHNWLNAARQSKGLPLSEAVTPFGRLREESFDRLAAHVRKHVDVAAIYEIMNGGSSSERHDGSEQT